MQQNNFMLKDLIFYDLPNAQSRRLIINPDFYFNIMKFENLTHDNYMLYDDLVLYEIGGKPMYSCTFICNNAYYPSLIGERYEKTIISNLIYDFYVEKIIAYDNPIYFLRDFKKIINNIYFNYNEKIKALDRLYNLDISAFQEVQKNFAVVANNDNTLPDNPLNELLPFINQQTVTNINESEYKGILNKIQLLRNNYTDEIIDSFRKLFIKIIPKTYYFFEKGE